MPSPRLIVGLGNPGSQYAATRHNCGFWFLERLARLLDLDMKRESRFHGSIAHVRDKGLWLLMPDTFMNRSGNSVGALARFYRVLPDEMIVIHDELDLPPGTLRLKCGGGLGGHNGLKDIVSHLGTQDFWRLRVGIGHPGSREEVINYVLNAPRREEQDAIDQALDRALEVWPALARGDYASAMQKLNVRPTANKTEADA